MRAFSHHVLSAEGTVLGPAILPLKSIQGPGLEVVFVHVVLLCLQWVKCLPVSCSSVFSLSTVLYSSIVIALGTSLGVRAELEEEKEGSPNNLCWWRQR